MTDEKGLMALDQAGTLSAQAVKDQVDLIQQVMSQVMIDGQHYGTIPGCGDKPALLKPGAEKICFTFRIATDPEIEDLSSDDEIRYRIKCRALSSSGIFLGAGVGECSSNEDKYKWRAVKSDAEWDATWEDRKRLKYGYKGETRQVRTNPADIANTILKMAKKRALVDMVLTVTAASDIFSQADDLPEGSEGDEVTEKIQTPKKKGDKKKDDKKKEKNEKEKKGDKKNGGNSNLLDWSGNVTGVEFEVSSGKRGDGDWTLHIVQCQEGMKFSAFSRTHAETAADAMENGLQVNIKYSKDGQGRNKIHEIEPIEG